MWINSSKLVTFYRFLINFKTMRMHSLFFERSAVLLRFHCIDPNSNQALLGRRKSETIDIMFRTSQAHPFLLDATTNRGIEVVQ